GRVHGNATAEVIAAAAEVGGVAQRRAAGIELRHKNIELTAAKSWLQRIRRREVGRLGLPRHVGLAGSVYGNAHVRAAAALIAAAAEVGGVDQRRAGGIELRHKSIPGAAAES